MCMIHVDARNYRDTGHRRHDRRIRTYITSIRNGVVTPVFRIIGTCMMAVGLKSSATGHPGLWVVLASYAPTSHEDPAGRCIELKSLVNKTVRSVAESMSVEVVVGYRSILPGRGVGFENSAAGANPGNIPTVTSEVPK